MLSTKKIDSRVDHQNNRNDVKLYGIRIKLL